MADAALMLAPAEGGAGTSASPDAAGADASSSPRDAALAALDAAPDYGGCAAREIALSDDTMLGSSPLTTSHFADNPEGGRVDFYDAAGWGSTHGHAGFASLQRSIETGGPIVELFRADGGADCSPEVRLPVQITLRSEDETVFAARANGHFTAPPALRVEYDGELSALGHSLASALAADPNTAALDRVHFEAVLIGDAPHAAQLRAFRSGQPASSGVPVLDWSAAPKLAGPGAQDCMTYEYAGQTLPPAGPAVVACVKSALASGDAFVAHWVALGFVTTEIGRLVPELARAGHVYYELSTSGGELSNARTTTLRRCASFSFTEPCTDASSTCYSCVDPGPIFNYAAFAVNL